MRGKMKQHAGKYSSQDWESSGGAKVECMTARNDPSKYSQQASRPKKWNFSARKQIRHPENTIYNVTYSERKTAESKQCRSGALGWTSADAREATNTNKCAGPF